MLAPMISGACALALSVTLLIVDISGQAPAQQASGQAQPCDLLNLALRERGKSSAKSQMWMDLASGLNTPGANMCLVFYASMASYADALALVESQFRARVEACAQMGQEIYCPALSPSEFTGEVQSRYFPMIPGQTLVYEASTSEGFERIESTTLRKLKLVNGYPCRQIRVLETLNGVKTEDTLDFFAQRNTGDVWYFGEVTQSFEDGFLTSLGGSWRAGFRGAQPGVAMPVVPTAGTIMRKEYEPDEAEDIIRVVSTNATAVTALGTYTACVQIEEYSPLEPNEREMKFFAPGVGLVLEINLVTGARTELVGVRNP